MKIDITSMFFNSKIEGQSATPAWSTSIGQNGTKECRLEIEKPGVVELISGLTYKSISDFENLDISKSTADRDIILCSVFNDIFVNNNKVDDSQFVALLVREHSQKHEGRLLFSYPPYAIYNGISNQVCIEKMQNLLGCSTDGCWFVYDISIVNQSELHFNAVVVNSTSPMVYSSKLKSQNRTAEWKTLIPSSEVNKQKNYGGESLQKIFFGTPGSGKSHKVENDILPKEDYLVFRTTFHPDTDYSSFVGCYKPQMKGNKIEYKFAPQVFTDAYVAAWNGLNMGEDYYLVIEEINRGNCAQIFGDLFQLLDRDKETGFSEYPIKADNDLRAYLEQTGVEEVLISKDGIKDGKLCLPPNLKIIATMNTSDQSLFPMDSAFKRRWSWEYVPIKYDETKSAAFLINIPNTPYEKWVDFLKKINGIILEKTDSEDKQMGNFFIKGDVEEQEFKDKVMFYLWSEVCKDSFHTKDNFFRTKDREFSYNELYGDKGHDLLVGFLDYIKNYKAKEDQTV